MRKARGIRQKAEEGDRSQNTGDRRFLNPGYLDQEGTK
jgi:hypothetical protein